MPLKLDDRFNVKIPRDLTEKLKIIRELTGAPIGSQVRIALKETYLTKTGEIRKFIFGKKIKTKNITEGILLAKEKKRRKITHQGKN